MNWYEHHIGDWLKKTSDLSLVQEGVYLRLVDWCYSHERPLPLLLKDVRKIARSRTQREHQAVQEVLDRFFQLHPDGWHNPRVDAVIAKYTGEEPKREARREHTKERQARARERRAAMFDGLREKGIVPPFNTTARELARLCEENGVTLPVTRDVTHAVTRDDTTNQSPLPITHVSNALSSVTAVTPSVTPTRAATACKAMKKAGFAQVNPSDPRLQALLDAGATDEELAMVAAEAAARSKGWAWLLAAVAGRRKDAATLANGNAPGSALTARQSAERARVEAWAPAIAEKRL